MKPAADLLDAVLDALADRIATRIADVRERHVYTSADLPPRCSRRRFAELCRRGAISGAKKIGREWECTRASWETARLARRPTAVAQAAPVVSDDVEAQAAALVARAGLRVVSGARR